jgi:hypothetical protein
MMPNRPERSVDVFNQLAKGWGVDLLNFSSGCEQAGATKDATKQQEIFQASEPSRLAFTSKAFTRKKA